MDGRSREGSSDMLGYSRFFEEDPSELVGGSSREERMIIYPGVRFLSGSRWEYCWLV